MKNGAETTDEGWLYVCGTIDLCYCDCVGLSFGSFAYTGANAASIDRGKKGGTSPKQG